MTSLVQVAVAGDVTEAEQLQELLTAAGIASQLELAAEHDPEATDDPPLKVLVPENDVEAARDAIEALAEESDEELGEPLGGRLRHPLDPGGADEAVGCSSKMHSPVPSGDPDEAMLGRHAPSGGIVALGDHLPVQEDAGREPLLAEERELEPSRPAREHLDPRGLATVEVAVRPDPGDALQEAHGMLRPPDRDSRLVLRSRHVGETLARDRDVRRRGEVVGVERRARGRLELPVGSRRRRGPAG